MSLPENQVVIVVCGPTGVGKTDLSYRIARKIPVEIISADSRQIYKYLDIGTAKPPKEILSQIPHHFIDILYPDQHYSAGQFGSESRKILREIFDRGKMPLVVGGSGLYIRAMIEGFFNGNEYNSEVRESLQQRLKKEGLESLYRELLKIDKKSASKIHPNNSVRILRALEVYLSTGKPLSELQAEKLPPLPFPVVKFGIHKDRRILYQDINTRVDQMFKRGLLAEVKNILQLGYNKNLNSLKTVGYKEVIEYIDGEIDFNVCVQQVKQNSRRYAKRQLTWFRNDKDVKWFEINDESDMKKILSQILKTFR